jgi:phytoene synthase
MKFRLLASSPPVPNADRHGGVATGSDDTGVVENRGEPLLPAWLFPLARAEGAGDPLGYLGRHSRSFRFACRFLPPAECRRTAEVYAWCRFTDDLVDAAGSAAPEIVEARLEDWRSLSRRVYDGLSTGLPLVDAPMHAMARAGVPFRYAEELIEGMRMDIRPRAYRDMDELELYTYRAAGTVGQWLTELAGVRSPWVLARAADLGHAMQLTNILRDVGEDSARGRVYLPLDALRRHGLDADDLAADRRWLGRPPAAWRDLMEEMLGAAEARYAEAFKGIPFLPDYFQRPVLVSALVYREIHAVLRRNGYDNFNLRAASTPGRKLSLGLQAYWLLPSLHALYPARPEAILGT